MLDGNRRRKTDFSAKTKHLHLRLLCQFCKGYSANFHGDDVFPVYEGYREFRRKSAIGHRSGTRSGSFVASCAACRGVSSHRRRERHLPVCRRPDQPAAAYGSPQIDGEGHPTLLQCFRSTTPFFPPADPFEIDLLVGRFGSASHNWHMGRVGDNCEHRLSPRAGQNPWHRGSEQLCSDVRRITRYDRTSQRSGRTFHRERQMPWQFHRSCRGSRERVYCKE
jgi:hypothetical protein